MPTGRGDDSHVDVEPAPDGVQGGENEASNDTRCASDENGCPIKPLPRQVRVHELSRIRIDGAPLTATAGKVSHGVFDGGRPALGAPCQGKA